MVKTIYEENKGSVFFMTDAERGWAELRNSGELFTCEWWLLNFDLHVVFLLFSLRLGN